MSVKHAFSPVQLLWAGLLAVLMAATRYSHLSTALSLPGASEAVFFLAGLVLMRPGYFLAYAIEGVWLDYLSSDGGFSGYCFTPAYAYLYLAYFSLWAGGYLVARHRGAGPRRSALLASVLLVACSCAFLISDASFYFKSTYTQAPALGGYWAHARQYYLPYLGVTAGYVFSLLAIRGALRFIPRLLHAWKPARGNP